MITMKITQPVDRIVAQFATHDVHLEKEGVRAHAFLYADVNNSRDITVHSYGSPHGKLILKFADPINAVAYAVKAIEEND
jgi:hypothetical protein